MMTREIRNLSRQLKTKKKEIIELKCTVTEMKKITKCAQQRLRWVYSSFSNGKKNVFHRKHKLILGIWAGQHYTTSFGPARDSTWHSYSLLTPWTLDVSGSYDESKDLCDRSFCCSLGLLQNSHLLSFKMSSLLYHRSKIWTSTPSRAYS